MADLRGDERNLVGSVARIVFHNKDNGWTVLRLSVEGDAILRTVVGAFQGLTVGERVKFSGKWIVDSKHGRQFKAEVCLPLAPATLMGIEKFLGSGMVPGIGKVMAKRMVDRFGLETLDVIESEPARLAEVEGIGPRRAKAISVAMREKRDIKEVMVFLESAGISPVFSHRIYKRYGKKAIRMVSENPYRLASDVHGIGFRSADKIAAHLGVPPNSDHRAEAGLIYTLEEFASEGHVFVPRQNLLPKAEALLEMDLQLLERSINRLMLMGGVVQEGKGDDSPVYLPRLHAAEDSAASNLKRILNSPFKQLPVNTAEAVSRAEQLSNIELAPEQRAAFDVLMNSKVMVLTGGPGTGKTTLLKGLVSCLADLKMTIALAAPTGRAARRMAESTGKDARTIHRLLEYTPRTNTFERCRRRPLDADVIFVDEVSMVDVELFAALLAAIKNNARLILVGDPDQLPSVGPGTVLSDLLRLGKRGGKRLGIVRLTEIFRQARSSLIVTGAHDILAGHEPRLGKKNSDADLFMVERENPQDCLNVIKSLISDRIPNKFGFDPIGDTQVLTPMHKGLLGATNLNSELQELLNPGDQYVEFRGIKYRLGDKIMQVRNNYDLEVFNGDIGRVSTIDKAGEWIEITYTSRTVRYPATELDQTALAYACSVHKSQGSEYPAVVIPLHTQHYVMLQRNLLYTALTRGKRLVVIVGSRRALKIAVRNDSMAERCSGLTQRTLKM